MLLTILLSGLLTATPPVAHKPVVIGDDWPANLSVRGTPIRGRGTWAFRCVLDNRPRMLVLALSPTWWAAYNTQNGTLAKFWQGGVKLQGTIYTTKHGPQPVSEGKPLLDHYVERDVKVWQVFQDGKELAVSAQYAGHKLEDGQVTLITRLTLPDGKVITVEETPELLQNRPVRQPAEAFSKNKKGQAKPPAVYSSGLGRVFSVKNAAGYEVRHWVQSGEQTAQQPWRIYNSSFKAVERRELLAGPEPVLIESGWLTLSTEHSTIIIHPSPAE